MGFKVLTHSNGTKTLVDEENAQAMHSRIGPEAEAKMVYADLARTETFLRCDSDRHVLYDVGMGTGANVLAVLSRIDASCAGTLEVHSFETKPTGLEAALAQPEDFPMLVSWKEHLETLLRDRRVEFVIERTEIRWSLHVGDFFESLSDSKNPPADTLFYDFYSPKVVPELWSREKFALLRKKLGNRAARIFTYSAATPVRLNLFLSGFFVGDGVSTGMKNETTVAATTLDLLEKPLTAAWLAKLETSASIASIPDRFDVRSHAQFTR